MPGGPYMAVYYATKAYVVSLTRAVAQELREQHSPVKVFALCPGDVYKRQAQGRACLEHPHRARGDVYRDGHPHQGTDRPQKARRRHGDLGLSLIHILSSGAITPRMRSMSVLMIFTLSTGRPAAA